MADLLISQSPQALLEQFGIEAPHEIWLEAIAQACQATIVYEALKGCEARLIGYADRAIITVNRGASLARQRFSAAHELGHWMWDRGRMVFQCVEKQLNGEGALDNVERRANRFAAELLLPQSMFQKLSMGKPIVFATVQELAQVFRTSLTATAIRLVELAKSPAVLVCLDKESRRWSGRSPAVSPYLLLRESPGKTTIVKKWQDGALTLPGPMCVSSEQWFNDENNPWEIQEDAIPIGKGKILSLLSWKSA